MIENYCVEHLLKLDSIRLWMNDACRCLKNIAHEFDAKRTRKKRKKNARETPFKCRPASKQKVSPPPPALQLQ